MERRTDRVEPTCRNSDSHLGSWRGGTDFPVEGASFQFCMIGVGPLNPCVSLTEFSWSRVTSLSNSLLTPSLSISLYAGLMFPLDHYEWRMPRLHYGPKNSREYARKRYRGTDGNWVLPMFPDPEEQYREFPFGYPHEQTVERKVLMPHFQRTAMERRILQGHATFQLSPGGEIPRKRGHPSRAPSAVGEPPRAFTGEYTEDFINQAKLCKPKTAEMWCGWYRDGIRGDIKARLRGILEPLEFALVKRMVGFAIETEAKIAAKLDVLSSAEKANTVGDPRMDAGNPGTSAGNHLRRSGGARMVQKPRTVRDYLEEFLETAKRCQPKPAEEWCRLFKAGLREDIHGQALDAEERLAEMYARAEPDYSTEDDDDPEPVVGGVGAAGFGPEADRGSSPRGGWLSD
ncbi:hypothetical protein Bca101_082198 [Brassica carinata]